MLGSVSLLVNIVSELSFMNVYLARGNGKDRNREIEKRIA